MKHLAVFVILAVTAGCAAEKTVTHIDSQPPGARILVNENEVGLAPVDVTLAQHTSHHWLRGPVTIKAIPSDQSTNEYRQVKFLPYHQEAPNRLLFIMTDSPPSRP